MQITTMTADHSAAVLAIYQAGIDEGNATFETTAPGWTQFSAAKLPGHRYVALAAGGVLGWVAAASAALHQAAGFRVVGTRERIGQHHGRWRDVLLIERRSTVVWPSSPPARECRRPW